MSKRKTKTNDERPASPASPADRWIDEAGSESFPASDPPAHSGVEPHDDTNAPERAPGPQTGDEQKRETRG